MNSLENRIRKQALDLIVKGFIKQDLITLSNLLVELDHPQATEFTDLVFVNFFVPHNEEQLWTAIRNLTVNPNAKLAL